MGPPAAHAHLPPSTRVHSPHRLRLGEEIRTHASNEQLRAANKTKPSTFPTQTKGRASRPRPWRPEGLGVSTQWGGDRDGQR